MMEFIAAIIFFSNNHVHLTRASVFTPRAHAQRGVKFSSNLMASGTGDFKSVVLKSRRESAHARTFGGDFELKILRMRGFSSRFWTMDLKSPVLTFSNPLSQKLNVNFTHAH